MAPRTVDAAVVQKDSLGVDELLSKLVTLEDQLASLKLQRKVPHHHQRSRSSCKSRRCYNPQGRYCYYHFRFRKKCFPGKCLLIDLHKKEINRDGVTNLSIKGEVATVQESNDLSTVNRTSKYFNLLNSYPDLTKPNLVNRIIKYGVKHHILTTLRPCGDYRRLNAQTVPDWFLIPRKDKEKTAITTPFGLSEFNTMSFGLRNAPLTFQRFISEVLYGLDFVIPYLDDVLVASSSEEEHSEHLKIVFERFQQYGLRINISKSVMGADQVEYLGFMITAEDSSPLPEIIEAISNYKLPETIHDLRTFLGIINFYRKYLKDAAKTQAPLHELLKGAKKKDRRKVHWTDNSRRSFEKCKTDLAEAALLSFPRSGLPLSLCTDTSDLAVSAVLQQLENEGWKPIAFYSKKLNETQTRYSTYDRELLGIYLSVKHFKHLLEGNDFIIYTDHKPLTFAFKQKHGKVSPRQQRQLQYISEFICIIQHVLGKDNVVADALSRIESIFEIKLMQLQKSRLGMKS
ncbi:retrovirus-related Pol polyprotein from transposon opus [Trichonephila clavipes]|nr:retrovirus-related Pol polyprotein from transposon opus [Trichonephila clavipes]